MTSQLMEYLQNGSAVILFRNRLRTYTAAVIHESAAAAITEVDELHNYSPLLVEGLSPIAAITKLSARLSESEEHDDKQ